MQSEMENFRIILGFIFLILGLIGSYWIGQAVLQLWYTPEEVEFVRVFIELARDNPLKVHYENNGLEFNLPEPWGPVIIGIFLSMVLMSGIVMLVKTLLVNSVLLLFPDLWKSKPEKQKNK